MNEIQIFNNPDFGEVRTAMIDGEPWFVGNDCARALGYKNLYNGVVKNTDSEDRRLSPIGSTSGTQDTLVINESGLYSLIFGSKLPSAKKFKRWVTSEVLPSLRKTGSYGAPKTIPEQIQLLAQGNVELNQKVDSLTDRVDKIELDLPILPIEADRITTSVKRKGVSILGGKQAPAYKNKRVRTDVYNKLHANLRWYFGVKTYKAIKRNQCDKAIEIIDKWEPPVSLADEIQACNSQIRLDI